MAKPSLFRIPVPPGWVIDLNDLFEVEASSESYERGFLKEDLLQVRRQDGKVLVDVGWYGGSPPDGIFRIYVHEMDFRGPLLEEHQVPRQSEIRPLIERLLRKYAIDA